MNDRAGFCELDLLRHPEGLVARITYRDMASGYRSYSFTLLKEFEQDGCVARTAFLNERHIDAVHELVELARERIQRDKDRLFTARRWKEQERR
jgi:hypothetical protein